MISMQFFLRIIVVLVLLVTNSTSFAMIKDEREKQGWRNLKQVYENADNLEFVKNFLLNEENHVPIIFINQSPIITQEHMRAIVINPYTLLSSEDSLPFQERRTKSYNQAYYNAIEKIKQKKFELLGLDAEKTPVKNWFSTRYSNDWRIMKAVFFGTKDDVVHALDDNVKNNCTRKVIKYDLQAAITASIDCSHVKKDILELLLWEKKKFHTYTKFTKKAGKKAFELLAIAAKNKSSFNLVVAIDPYNQHNKAYFFDDEQESKTLLDCMYENDNFDAEHIKIMRDNGALRKIENKKSILTLTKDEIGLDNLMTLYKKQTLRFVRKFLADEKNYIPVYIVNTGDALANQIFFGSLINAYEKSFYENSDEQHFTEDIIKIGKMRLDETLTYEQFFYQDPINIKSLDINNPLIKAICLGNQQKIEAALVKSINREKAYHNLNKAIGAAISFNKMEALKLLLYEQKVFIRKNFSFDDIDRGKISYVLILIALCNDAAFKLVAQMDPYNANQLPWKDDNETEYKTNLDRLLSLNLAPSFYNDLASCGWITSQQVYTFNELIIDNIIKELPSRNNSQINEFNRAINNVSWNWIQKQRMSI